MSEDQIDEFHARSGVAVAGAVFFLVLTVAFAAIAVLALREGGGRRAILVGLAAALVAVFFLRGFLWARERGGDRESATQHGLRCFALPAGVVFGLCVLIDLIASRGSFG